VGHINPSFDEVAGEQTGCQFHSHARTLARKHSRAMGSLPHSKCSGYLHGAHNLTVRLHVRSSCYNAGRIVKYGRRELRLSFFQSRPGRCSRSAAPHQ
jgi:hypothetical protein